MSKIYSLNQIAELKARDFFIDANVIISFFNESNSPYLKAILELQRYNCNLYLDFIVISEVINRLMKIKFMMIKKKYLNKYKSFRDSVEGKSYLNEIYMFVRDMVLTNFHIIENPIGESDIKNFLTSNTLDINDKAIVSICKKKKMILLTHDYDFKESNIDILTGNKKMLRKK